MPEGNLNRFFLFLLLLAYPCANAQPSTELQTNGYGYLANFNSSTAMVIVFLLCAFFLMGFFSVYIRRCPEAANAESAATRPPATVGSSRQKGLDQAVIESFPILVYSAVKDLKIGKGALECAVCLSKFDEYETLRLLPKCDHVFHPDCIDAWLAAHVTCPVCRAKLEPNPNPNPNNEFKNLESSSRIEVGEVQNDAVAVNVDENESGDSQAVVQNLNRPARCGKLPRSHSTGHSLSQPERYTLRLPEEVRRQLVSNKLRRSTSYDVVLPRVGSSRKGYRYGGGEGKASVDNQTGWFDPWVLFRTPLFLSRGGSVIVKSPKGGGHGEEMFGETPSRPVKMPFDCLNVKAERSKELISRLPV